jgi:shikimate kinase
VYARSVHSETVPPSHDKLPAGMALSHVDLCGHTRNDSEYDVSGPILMYNNNQHIGSREEGITHASLHSQLFEGGESQVCGTLEVSWVKRVLLTGMSGTGKSTLTCELAALGYKAIDADTDEWSEWVEISSAYGVDDSPVRLNEDWVWREEPIKELLATADAEVLFVSGCAENMVQFFPQFDHIVLLSVPADVIVERLATRTNNAYGKHPEEVTRVLGLQQTIEPRLRKVAGYEINTDAPIDQVLATLLRLVA